MLYAAPYNIGGAVILSTLNLNLLALSVLLAACGGKDETNETGKTQETGTQETGDTHDTGPPIDTAGPSMVFSLAVYDYENRDPIEGMTFTTDWGDTYTTDDDGEIVLDLPWDVVTALTGTFSGYPALRNVFNADGTWDEFTIRQYVASSSALGMELDPTKGHLYADVYAISMTDEGNPDREELPGVTLSLDMAAETTLYTSGTVSGGFAEGAETEGGGTAGTAILFLNIPPGTGTLTHSSAAGYTCSHGPSMTGADSFEVEILADTTTRMMVLCR